MRYPRILCILSIFAFMGIGVTGIKHVGAEEWVASFEAFKSADDPAYHQRHSGNIEWHLFQDSSESNGDAAWNERIKDAESTSQLKHLTPAKVVDSKYHSPCPLCECPTYFWLSADDLDSDVERFIKGDFPGWDKADGVCRNCYECYELRTGKYFGGSLAASTTDEYVIGFNKSPRVRDYFRNVK
ncbi:MAG: hypothetical protein K8F52_08210 [Candidatus Scalindua rubra]|uniref:Uncharacterized protein n=1 Tax=Candidatus Scalindua brodae TaxID=237368 RepID=A0A0B0EKP8_9BACT|nr:MAG: hypothetical protein SCABRO_01073 [Candidatus Scalindua brodae]MBZ0108641.1 hypothetical protein [Candidatus Scalindua rubra]TWU37996.1 hypothetical protein S225a_00420 [Candidatus Brocadiaceae bacterium S225]